MTAKELVQVLVKAHKIVEEEWNKRTPEQRRKICENILARSRKFTNHPQKKRK